MNNTQHCTMNEPLCRPSRRSKWEKILSKLLATITICNAEELSKIK